MGGEKVELRRQRRGDAIERSVPGDGERGERLLQLGGPAREHRIEQPALGMEVVEQQLLVDPSALGDLIDSRPVEAASGELVPGGGDDP